MWASTKVAAAILGISPNALRIRKCRGEIQCRYFGKHLRFNVGQLQTHFREQPVFRKVLEKYRIEYRTSTYFNYKHSLNKWFDPVWNEKFVDEIKPSDVHKVIFESMVGTSSYTKRGLLKIVRRVFNIAIEEGLIVRNPAVGIRVKCADANQAVLNKNEIEILLRQAKRTEHRFFPHWTLALLTGMRSGELYSLRWTDVDVVTGKINISKA